MTMTNPPKPPADDRFDKMAGTIVARVSMACIALLLLLAAFWPLIASVAIRAGQKWFEIPSDDPVLMGATITAILLFVGILVAVGVCCAIFNAAIEDQKKAD
jgi:hypothetical protein